MNVIAREIMGAISDTTVEQQGKWYVVHCGIER